MDFPYLLSRLCVEFSLDLGDQILIGENCKTVFRAKQLGRPMVVKIGYGEQACQEVESNRRGYNQMLRIGAGALVPDVLEFQEIDGVPFILMDDYGSNFMETVKSSSNPVACFRELLVRMRTIYTSSRSEKSPVPALVSLRDFLVLQWTDFLPRHVVSEDAVHRIRQLTFDGFADVHSCFSTFEFKPDDLFLFNGGIKKVDPVDDNLGCPAVDLGCFSGVSRDAYHLPGSRRAYPIFRRFVREELPEILGGTADHFEGIFYLGRALQCALSARFRMDSSPDQAERFARSSVRFARRCEQRLLY